MNDNAMNVKVLNINTGLQEYDDVKFIKVKSKDYNLLIMRDYLPIIGEVEGDIRIELTDQVVEFNNISGYFMNKKNRFTLFIKEEEKDD